MSGKPYPRDRDPDDWASRRPPWRFAHAFLEYAAGGPWPVDTVRVHGETAVQWAARLERTVAELEQDEAVPPDVLNYVRSRLAQARGDAQDPPGR